MPSFRLIILTLTVCTALNNRALADTSGDHCGNVSKDVPIKSIQASAGVWANWRNSSGSISFESNEIFLKAKAASDSLAYPAPFCPAGCSTSKRAVLFFRSVPHKVLTDDEDSEYCKGLLAKTQKSPIRYQTLEVHSVDDLNEWIGDLSQGEGKFGEDLYEKCDKSCSPRFEYTVAKRGESEGQFLVKASIVCGEARDKDDGMYNLEAFFRWECEKG